MDTRLSLVPGQNGTRKLLAAYGDRLVPVRYRYNAQKKVRHKTVELIVETTPWNPCNRNPRRRPEDRVGVRIARAEIGLRECIRAGRGIRRPRHEPWEADWRTVCELGLQDRVVAE